MRTLSLCAALLISACHPTKDTAESGAASSLVPWSGDLPPLSGDIGEPRGFTPLRTTIHLHSPYSHDACDGDGWVDGVLDEECLAQLRDGLCRTSMDVAFLTDHPSYGAFQPFEDLLLMRDDDDAIQVAGQTVASRMHCDTGHEVLWAPGFEDVLMPLALDAHAAPYGDEADAIYNSDSTEAIAAELAAGGQVFMAHTEGRERADLERYQDDGLQGLELFNLHAMLDPSTREDIFGLDALGWIGDVGPFTSPDGTGEPDLMFAAFFQEQLVSVQHWEALLARGPMVGVAGNDAHRNVMDMALRDGERVDSYRRMLRWFSNIILADGTDLTAAEAALAAGRVYPAFEIFGTPDGLAFWYEGPDGALEMGGSCTDCVGGTLHLACPTLSPASPRDGENEPQITAILYKDGQVWQQDCGDHAVSEAGNYRARIDILPAHLTAFLGEDPSPYLKDYPWVYTNALRIGG